MEKNKKAIESLFNPDDVLAIRTGYAGHFIANIKGSFAFHPCVYNSLSINDLNMIINSFFTGYITNMAVEYNGEVEMRTVGFVGKKHSHQFTVVIDRRNYSNAIIYIYETDKLKEYWEKEKEYFLSDLEYMKNAKGKSA